MEKPLLCPIICFAPVVGDNSEEGEDEQEGDTPFRSPTFPHNLVSWDGLWHGQR